MSETKPYSFSNIADHLDDPQCQFVDIREPYELTQDGFIQGFACVPLYTALLHKSIIEYVPNPFESNAVRDASALAKLFDRDKHIYLMCNSGARSGYLTAVLKSQGYTVTNLGGIIDYHRLHAK